jgi:hypothetical protein
LRLRGDGDCLLFKGQSTYYKDSGSHIEGAKDFDCFTPKLCGKHEFEVELDLVTYNYAAESSWSIVDGQVREIIGKMGYTITRAYTDTLCVPIYGSCYTFSFNDTVKNGICCSYGEGEFATYVDGVELPRGSAFDESQQTQFGC